MKKLLLAFVGLGLLGFSPAHSQTVLPPSDTVNCAYNSALPTIVTGSMARIQCDSNGSLILSASSGPMQVVGNVASGATDSGNPVKVGGVYNSTLPTFTNGQRGNLQIGTRGSLNVSLFGPDGTLVANTGNISTDAVATSFNGLQVRALLYAINGAGTMDRVGGSTAGLFVQPQAVASGGASFARIAAGQATTTVKSGAGTLYAICLNSAAVAGNTTNIYDSTGGATAPIGTPAATTATVPTCLTYGPVGLAFANGLTFITAVSNGSDMTVSFK